jgi:hypothetical protein
MSIVDAFDGTDGCDVPSSEGECRARQYEEETCSYQESARAIAKHPEGRLFNVVRLMGRKGGSQGDTLAGAGGFTFAAMFEVIEDAREVQAMLVRHSSVVHWCIAWELTTLVGCAKAS